MAVRQPYQHGGAGRRGLVAADQVLAGLDQAEALRGVDALRLQHRRGQHLAHAALEGQPPVAGAGPGRGAAAFGAEIEEPPVREVVQLREQEAAAVPELGVVRAELVAVVAQRQRLLEAARQGLEPAEMGDPFLVRQAVEADPLRPDPVAVAQDRLREVGGRDAVEEIRPEVGVAAGGPESVQVRQGGSRNSLGWGRGAGSRRVKPARGDPLPRRPCGLAQASPRIIAAATATLRNAGPSASAPRPGVGGLVDRLRHACRFPPDHHAVAGRKAKSV